MTITTVQAFIVLRNSRTNKSVRNTDRYKKVARWLAERYSIDTIIDESTVTFTVVDSHSDLFIRNLSVLRISWNVRPFNRAQYPGSIGQAGVLPLYPVCTRMLRSGDRGERRRPLDRS